MVALLPEITIRRDGWDWDDWEGRLGEGRLRGWVRSQYVVHACLMNGAVIVMTSCSVFRMVASGGNGEGKEGMWNKPKRLRWSG